MNPTATTIGGFQEVVAIRNLHGRKPRDKRVVFNGFISAYRLMKPVEVNAYGRGPAHHGCMCLIRRHPPLALFAIQNAGAESLTQQKDVDLVRVAGFTNDHGLDITIVLAAIHHVVGATQHCRGRMQLRLLLFSWAKIVRAAGRKCSGK